MELSLIARNVARSIFGMSLLVTASNLSVSDRYIPHIHTRDYINFFTLRSAIQPLLTNVQKHQTTEIYINLIKIPHTNQHNPVVIL